MNEQPLSFILLGAFGDLAWRLVVPALFDLFRQGQLPARFKLIGLDRKPAEVAEFADHLRGGVDRFSRMGMGDASHWEDFARHLAYLPGEIAQAGSLVAPQISAAEDQWGARSLCVYYLAIPPALFAPAAESLAAAGLATDPERSRLVVEKPLGRDLASFQALDGDLTAHFQESQLYRMDHFLGKETVMNLLALRFANPLFEPLWDRRYIDHVAITVAETLGVEGRAGYYETAGALRDMVQNHLLQIFCLVTMEPPAQFEAESLRDRKMDVFHALRPIPLDRVAQFATRGQYGPGHIAGQPVPAYRDEPGVAEDSNTETYAALKLHVDNWRWQDVPFYLRTGKRMAADVSEVSIRFRQVPHRAWPRDAAIDEGPVRLVLRLAPHEGIDLKLAMKVPGSHFTLRQQDLRFTYREAFQMEPPRPYETLLAALLAGDASHFMRADQVAAAWRLLDPVLSTWADTPVSFPDYPAGSWGPVAASDMLRNDGRDWLTPTLDAIGEGASKAKAGAAGDGR